MLEMWDFILLLIIIVGAGYGFIFRKGQIVVLFVSSYISFVVVNELGVKIFKWLDGIAHLTNFGDWAETAFKFGLFFVIMVLLAIWGEYLAASSGKKGMTNLILSGIYGALLALMLLSILSFFLSVDLEMQILALSRFSIYVIDYRMWWFFLPALLMLVSGFFLARKENNK